MIRLDIGLDYNEYLTLASEEEKSFIDEFYNRAKLQEDTLHKIKNVNENLHILVFAEPRCKDAATEIPFLLKMAELNHRITVRFLRREGNENLLKKETGYEKVPTFVILNNIGEVVRKYVEFPYDLKLKLNEAGKEEAEKIIEDMRQGKYDSYIEKDIVRFLTNENYNFIGFEKKDN